MTLAIVRYEIASAGFDPPHSQARDRKRCGYHALQTLRHGDPPANAKKLDAPPRTVLMVATQERCFYAEHRSSVVRACFPLMQITAPTARCHR